MSRSHEFSGQFEVHFTLRSLDQNGVNRGPDLYNTNMVQAQSSSQAVRMVESQFGGPNNVIVHSAIYKPYM
jgi:hypothetical protein